MASAVEEDCAVSLFEIPVSFWPRSVPRRKSWAEKRDQTGASGLLADGAKVARDKEVAVEWGGRSDEVVG